MKILCAARGAIVGAVGGLIGMSVVSFIVWNFDTWGGGEIRLLILCGFIGAVLGAVLAD